MQIYAQAQTERGNKVTVYGSNRPIKLFFAKPDWSNDEEEAFLYRGHRYYLSEFMKIDKYAPKFMQEYDGYLSDSFFSGILVKYIPQDDEHIKAYTYIA